MGDLILSEDLINLAASVEDIGKIDST